MTATPLTILVAEDHPLFRQALVDLLGGRPGWTVVAEAEDGVGAVTAAHAEQPDVAVMDLKLPRLDGIEATRRIVAASPHIGVLVLTMYDDDASVFEAMRAGARGYLLKGADRAEVVRAVADVAAELVLSPKTVRNHVSNIFAKLHVADRSAAIVKAREAGLGLSGGPR
jgi:DNA-binding NarL/FixJ family response regulator